MQQPRPVARVTRGAVRRGILPKLAFRGADAPRMTWSAGDRLARFVGHQPAAAVGQRDGQHHRAHRFDERIAVGQLLAFFRCLSQGGKPDTPSQGVLTRVVEDFAIHGD